MDENKSVKVSLGTVICIVIILILSFALIIVYYFGFVAEENSIEKSNLDTNINNLNETISNANDDNVSTNNTVEFNQTDYVIQFDEYLLGEEYETAGNELKEESYTISFLNNNEFNIYMGFGNSVQGNYTISNNIVNCILTTARGEYSPIQEIEGKISFRIISDSEIEIIDIPKSYTIRLSELSDSGWVLTDETKEMRFWPLVEGIKYIANK